MAESKGWRQARQADSHFPGMGQAAGPAPALEHIQESTLAWELGGSPLLSSCCLAGILSPCLPSTGLIQPLPGGLC